MVTTLKDEVDKIVSQATFLPERLDDLGDQPSEILVEKDIASTRLQAWSHTSAQNNADCFEHRLEWDGLDREKVIPVLGTPAVSLKTDPEYAKTIETILEKVPTIEAGKAEVFLDLNNPVPFEDLLISLVLVARYLLLNFLDFAEGSLENLSLLTKTAYLKWEYGLLQRLAKITTKTLQAEFSSRRTVGESHLLSFLSSEKNYITNKKYDGFVIEIWAEGWLGIFKKYPVVARLIGTTINLWVESTNKLVNRIATDLPEINQQFGGDLKSNVLDIMPNLSDSHQHGQSVLILTFDDGLKLVYKPKDLGIELAYNQFLEWFNQQKKLPLPFKVVKVLNRKNYGWMEYVENLPCTDETAAKRFYQRAGMLLCFLYVLNTTDCHHENLIACGEDLVLIDGETIMHHNARWMEENEKTATFEANCQIIDSPIYTGLLPAYDFGPQGVAYDVSGLGSGLDQPQTKVPRLKNINTDQMYLGMETVNLPRQKNVSFLNGKPLSPGDYITELVEGYEQMYLFLSNHTDVLLSDNGPLANFRSCSIRFINRATRVYAQVLDQALKPEYLKDGRDFSIQLDFLSRAYLQTDAKPHNWPILGAELKQIHRLDIPFFEAEADSEALILADKQLVFNFQNSSYNLVRDRIARLDESQLYQHLNLIQLVFCAQRSTGNVYVAKNSTQIVTSTQDGGEALTATELVNEAEAIAFKISSQAFKGSDGSLAWLGLNHSFANGMTQLLPLAYNYYDGNCGVALFYAALFATIRKDTYRELTLGCLRSLRKILPSDSKSQLDFAKKMGIGGAVGLGSIVYALTKVGEFLKLPEIMEDAKVFAELITPDLIAGDRKFDIIEGAAGAILGLLALYQQTEDSEVLQKASDSGKHLLDYCDRAYSGRKYDFEQDPMTGFAHGASGIAYALLRLYAVTGDQALIEGALKAIAYENTFFVSSVSNWREFTPASVSASAFWSTWCHGAPGIGLGRLGGFGIHRTTRILGDVQVALVATQRNELQIDHVCCGHFGRVETLLLGARELSEPHYYEAALSLATTVVKRAQHKGSYELFGNLPTPVFNPSFFKGLSGIGYQLLRLADPELPSLLLWE